MAELLRDMDIYQYFHYNVYRNSYKRQVIGKVWL